MCRLLLACAWSQGADLWLPLPWQLNLHRRSPCSVNFITTFPWLRRGEITTEENTKRGAHCSFTCMRKEQPRCAGPPSTSSLGVCNILSLSQSDSSRKSMNCTAHPVTWWRGLCLRTLTFLPLFPAQAFLSPFAYAFWTTHFLLQVECSPVRGRASRPCAFWHRGRPSSDFSLGMHCTPLSLPPGCPWARSQGQLKSPCETAGTSVIGGWPLTVPPFPQCATPRMVSSMPIF